MLVKIDTANAQLFQFTAIAVGEHTAIVDTTDLERIQPYTWYPKKNKSRIYAVRKVLSTNATFLVYMHRQITHCPNHLVVHHLNRNTLDNRNVNLKLMSPLEHNILHQFQ